MADGETLSIQSGNLYRLLYTDNEIGKLKIANSLWLDDDMNGEPIEFKKSFVKNAAENFYASSHSVDFADADTTEKAMTKWVFDNTNGTLNPSFEFDRIRSSASSIPSTSMTNGLTGLIRIRPPLMFSIFQTVMR